jgi:hypothetical protein
MSSRLGVESNQQLIIGNGDVTLSSIVKIKGGKRIPKGMHYSNEETGYKYLRVDDINESGEVDPSPLN